VVEIQVHLSKLKTMTSCSPLTPPPPRDIYAQQTDVFGSTQDESIIDDRKKEIAKAQKLLSMLKNIDKKNSLLSAEEIRNSNEEALHLLLEFQLNLSRNGGLFGDQESRAQSLLSSTSGTEAIDGNKNGNAKGTKQKKRGRSGRSAMDINAIRKAIFVVDTGTTPKNQGNSLREENLWLSALGRVIGAGKKKKVEENVNEDSADESKIALAVVEVAASCITSMCEHAKQNLGSLSPESQFCAKTVLEIMSILANQWLNSLMNKVQESLLIFDPTETYYGMKPERNKKMTQPSSSQTSVASNAASSCLKAAVSIITLVGIRLSRSTQIVAILHNIAQKALGCGPLLYNKQIQRDYSIVVSASTLLAALPLTGNSGVLQTNHNFNFSSPSNNSSPTKLWTEAVSKAINEMRFVLTSAYKYKNISSSLLTSFNESEADTDGWLQNLRTNVSAQENRSNAIHVRIEGLKYTINSLLRMEGYIASENNADIFIKCYLPLQSLLQVCELLIKFGQGAESKYLSSKNSTVRDSIAENGFLLSSSSIVSITNHIRCAGFDLLLSLMAIAGSSATSPLLTYGKSLIELIHYGISTTSSIGVQRHFHRLPSKRQQQWLNKSVCLRIKVIESMRVGCLVLGSACSTSPVMGKSAVIVAACLLEQIHGHRINAGSGKEFQWSTLSEQVSLAIKAAETISAFISVGGGYIHSTIRSTLESTVSSCLSMLLPSSKTFALSEASLNLQNSSMKIALLNLASNAITAPWQDGGISTIIPKVRQVLSVLRFDRDPNVVATALHTLNICNMIIIPRSIPLSIETSRKMSDNLSGLSNALVSPTYISSLPSKKRKTKKMVKSTDTSGKNSIVNESAQLKELSIPEKVENMISTDSTMKSKIDFTNEAEVTDTKEDEENEAIPTKNIPYSKRKKTQKLSDFEVEQEAKQNNDSETKIETFPKNAVQDFEEERIESKTTKGEIEVKILNDDSEEVKVEQETLEKTDLNIKDESMDNDGDESSVEDSDSNSDGSFPEIIDSDPDEDDL